MTVYVRLEVLQIVKGLWCRACLLPSGVEVHFVMGGRVGRVRRCVDCAEPV